MLIAEILNAKLPTHFPRRVSDPCTQRKYRFAKEASKSCVVWSCILWHHVLGLTMHQNDNNTTTGSKTSLQCDWLNLKYSWGVLWYNMSKRDPLTLSFLQALISFSEGSRLHGWPLALLIAPTKNNTVRYYL